jgi:murein L,D-transpeptidase YcbB/YkuD
MRRHVMMAVLLLLGSLAHTVESHGAGPAIDTAVDRIRARVERDAAADLRRLYEAFGHQPLWHLHPADDRRLQTVSSLLATAARHGLDVAQPENAKTDSAEALAEHDLSLSKAVLEAAEGLRFGRLSRRERSHDWHIESDRFDVVGSLIQSLKTNTLATFAESLPPPHGQYHALLEAQQRYRHIVADGGWPIVRGEAELVLTGGDARLADLRKRLLIEGDLAAITDDPGALAEAVLRFQLRHDLEPDGRVGGQTLAALQVSAAQRLMQIEANLERWRWLPHALGDSHIFVNVAAARLALVQDGAPVMQMRVIVGDRLHPTPVFAASVTSVTLNPPWNVPPGIAAREILPRLKRNPGYLAANDMVIVGRPNDPFGAAVDWRSLSSTRFPFRLQQQPGTQNSLGRLKLEMPNRFDVFLHDTPARALFARNQRALSHGCIRLERPVDLAGVLLGRPDLESQIASGETQGIPLPRRVPVYLTYFTASVGDDGRAHFHHDLYGRDAPIERALMRDRHIQVATRGAPGAGGCPAQKPIA